jgi:hypothetical protein
MEEIYYWIGLIIFWSIATGGILIIIGFLFAQILNEAGRQFKEFWIIVDFAKHRKEFKKWMEERE